MKRARWFVIGAIVVSLATTWGLRKVLARMQEAD